MCSHSTNKEGVLKRLRGEMLIFSKDLRNLWKKYCVIGNTVHNKTQIHDLNSRVISDLGNSCILDHNPKCVSLSSL